MSDEGAMALEASLPVFTDAEGKINYGQIAAIVYCDMVAAAPEPPFSIPMQAER